MTQTLLLILALVVVASAGASVWSRARRAQPAPRAHARVGPQQAVRAPVLGVLRLDAEAGRLWEAQDRPALAPLFTQVRTSDRDVPECDVLMIYGALDPAGRFGGTAAGLREIVRDAGAKVVVVASDNLGAHYIAAARQTGYRLANLVMVLDRKGDAFSRFMRQIFAEMYRGVPMLHAWVRLAPQVPGAPHPGLPESIFAAEVGDLTFEAPPPPT